MKPPTHPKRTLEEADALRQGCVAGIAEGLEIKAIASKLCICQTYARTILARMGYEKTILSVDERWAIRQIRAGKGHYQPNAILGPFPKK